MHTKVTYDWVEAPVEQGCPDEEEPMSSVELTGTLSCGTMAQDTKFKTVVTLIDYSANFNQKF